MVGQLLQGGGGLTQDPVHAGRTVGVGGDLGDDEHGPGTVASVGLVDGPLPVGRMPSAVIAMTHPTTPNRGGTSRP